MVAADKIAGHIEHGNHVLNVKIRQITARKDEVNIVKPLNNHRAVKQWNLNITYGEQLHDGFGGLFYGVQGADDGYGVFSGMADGY